MHAFGSLVTTGQDSAKAALQLAANLNMASYEVMPKFDLSSLRDISMALNDKMIQFLATVAIKLRLTYGDVVGQGTKHDLYSLLEVAYPHCDFRIPAPAGKELTQLAALVLIAMRLYIRELTEMTAKILEIAPASPEAPAKS